MPALPLFGTVTASIALGAASFAILVAHSGTHAQEIELRHGLLITTSVRIVPKTYALPAPTSLDSALIVIRGDDITVDFNGAELRGMDVAADPDQAAGVAVHIEGGRNVRLINARIRGYAVAILARGTRGLELADNDLSHNWKPRLFSLVEHESLVDWLSYHRNEQDEWLRFGAAVYLADVRGGEIRGNRIEQGMNGVMLVRTDSLRIWNNVIAFNSGVGIGLYRSSENTVMHNHADFNVRGYSHGFYRRGQDSADLLVYEQSSRNVVAYNSMTHGGDGLFLWAGQSTMDTGQGGANDNLFFGNDFSFAPTNGMEATFSRNSFIANRVEGSEHGLWGGYSFDSKVIANDFVRNRFGVSIEHGQNNEIALNRFQADSTAVHLWANPTEPSDWGYPKHRDTRSRDHRVTGNVFAWNRTGVRATRTTNVTVSDNTFAAVDSLFVLRDTTVWSIGANDTSSTAPDPAARPRATLPPDVARLAPPRLPGGLDPEDAPMARRDRAAIIVDEWGPYDWRYPRLWPADSSRTTPLTLRVLGPEGTWRVVDRRGIARVSRETGRMNDTIVVVPAAGAEGDWRLELEYVGEATTSPRGERGAAGEPYSFSHEQFEPAIDWTVRFFAWADSTDPRSQAESFTRLLEATPLRTDTAPRIDYMWYRPTMEGVPQEKLAIEATGTVTLPSGEYTLRTISDDGVRVWVDDRLVIDNWTPHESAVDLAPLTGGTHNLRVQQYQVGGWTELRVEIVRGVQQSTGSPGPH